MVARLAEGAPGLLRTVLQRGGTHADLFLEQSHHTQYALTATPARHSPLQRQKTSVAGFAARVLQGSAQGFAAVPSLAPSAWHRCAASAAEQIDAGRAATPTPLGALHAAAALPPDAPGFTSETEKRALLEAATDAALAADPRITDVAASYQDHTRRTAVATAGGLLVAQAQAWLGLRVTVTLRKGQKRVQGQAVGGGPFGFGHFFEQTPEQLAAAAVAQAVRKAEARPLPQPPTSVVFAGGFGGVWLHEALGHLLEADVGSTLRDRLGDPIAPPFLTLTDDPTHPAGRVQQAFDDEGTGTHPTSLIEAGTLQHLLTDRRTAHTFGLPVTGHARRQDYRHAPLPRMTNLCLAPGPAAPADLLAGVQEGLYVTHISHGHLSPTTGQFALEVALGYRIENGQLTHPVAPLRLYGTTPALLHQITGLADDALLDPARGQCMKQGQALPVGISTPTVRVEGLSAVRLEHSV